MVLVSSSHGPVELSQVSIQRDLYYLEATNMGYCLYMWFDVVTLRLYSFTVSSDM